MNQQLETNITIQGEQPDDIYVISMMASGSGIVPECQTTAEGNTRVKFKFPNIEGKDPTKDIQQTREELKRALIDQGHTIIT